MIPIVLNIPHSSSSIPGEYLGQYLVPHEILIYENLILTDWYTDELFDIPDVHQVIAPVSRVLVDTERYADDDQESMTEYGMGVLYTRSTHGDVIRQITEEQRKELLDRYYYPHHNALEDAVQACLRAHGSCLLVDCHSFPDTPFPHETDTGDRPDFCLGTTKHNTPSELVGYFAQGFEGQGYTVAMDCPYSGCMLPERFAGDQRVKAIMIEVNRKLYMDQTPSEVRVMTVGSHCIPTKNQKFESIQLILESVISESLRTFK